MKKCLSICTAIMLSAVLFASCDNGTQEPDEVVGASEVTTAELAEPTSDYASITESSGSDEDEDEDGEEEDITALTDNSHEILPLFAEDFHDDFPQNALFQVLGAAILRIGTFVDVLGLPFDVGDGCLFEMGDEFGVLNLGQAVEYHGRLYAPVDVNKFPQLKSLQSIRETIDLFFTTGFVEQSLSHLFDDEADAFINIDGVLHRLVLDDEGWVLDCENMQIEIIDDESFLATIHLSERTIALTFVVEDGFWKIDRYVNLRLPLMATQGPPFFVVVTDIDQMLSLSYVYFYFGRPTCSFCVVFQPQLEEIAEETENMVYYFNTDTWRGHERFSEITGNFGVRTVPFLVFVTSDGFEVVSTGQDNDNWKSHFLQD